MIKNNNEIYKLILPFLIWNLNLVKKNEFLFHVLKKTFVLSLFFMAIFFLSYFLYHDYMDEKKEKVNFETVVTTVNDNNDLNILLKNYNDKRDKKNIQETKKKHLSLNSIINIIFLYIIMFYVSVFVIVMLFILSCRRLYTSFILRHTSLNPIDYEIINAMSYGRILSVTLKKGLTYKVYPYFVSSSNAYFTKDKYFLCIVISEGYVDDKHQFVINKDYSNNVVKDLEFLLNSHIGADYKKKSIIKKVKNFFVGIQLDHSLTFKLFGYHSKRINFSEISEAGISLDPDR